MNQQPKIIEHPSLFNSFISFYQNRHYLQPKPWAVITILIGIFSLFGWLISFIPLITFIPDTVPIAPNTALLFLLCGIILFYYKPDIKIRDFSRIQTILSLFCLIIAIITIADVYTGYQFHIDRLINPLHNVTDGIFFGHMSPVTALLFILTALGFLLSQKHPEYTKYAGLTVATSGAVVILGYLYGAPLLYGGTIIPVAFLTGIGFFILGTGLFLCTTPSFLFYTDDTQQSVKYLILKYFLPFFLAVLLLEGWIISHLLQKNDQTFVLMIAFITIITIVITLLMSHFFSRIIATNIDEANTLRRTAEHELSNTLTQLKLAVQNAGTGFWSWDFTTDEMTFDDKTYEILKVEKGKIMTISQFMDMVHQDERLSLDELSKIKQQADFHSEFTIILPDLTRIIIEANGIVLESGLKNSKHMVGMVWDITRRKQLIHSLHDKNEQLSELNEELTSQEEELMQQYVKLQQANDEIITAQQFTQEIISQAGEGIISLNADGIIVTWNQFMEHFSGVPANNIIGKKISDSCLNLIFPDNNTYISQVLSGQQVTVPDTEFTYKPSQSSGWFTAIYAPHRDLSGKTVGVIITIKDISERKKIEKSLVLSEKILKGSQSLAKIGGWEFDINEKKMFWTEETYAIHEIDPAMFSEGSQEHIALSVSCYNEADRKTVLTAFNRCVEIGEPFDAQYPFTTTKGKRLWIRTQGQAEWENGEIFRVIGTMMDITREKAYIAEIERERLSLRNIFDLMPDGVYMVDKNYQIRYKNPIIRKLFGEPAGKLCYEYLHGRTSPCPWCKNQQVFAGESVHWEHETETTARIYDLFDTPFTTPEGEIYKLEFFHDITNLRRTETELAESIEYLNRLIRYANVPILVWNTEWKIQTFNHAFERLSGYKSEEVIGKPIHTLFPKESHDMVNEVFWEQMKKGQIYARELPIQRPDGTIAQIIWNAAQIPDAKGNIRAIFAQGRDVSRERELENDKIVAINQIQKNFAELAILNDGIRNPLTVITMQVDLHCPQIYQDILIQVRKIDQIVNQLDNRWIESESVLHFLHKHHKNHMENQEKDSL